MRISDWSSDVCSSDLTVAVSGHDAPTLPPHPGMMSDLGALVGDGGSDQPARPNVISTLVPPPSRAQSSKRPPLASAVRRTMSRPRPVDPPALTPRCSGRSEEHTSELQSLMRISYAVFCLKKK